MTNVPRFLLVTVDHKTGAHTLHNWPSAPRAKCIELAQSMPMVLDSKHRLLLKTHDTSPTN